MSERGPSWRTTHDVARRPDAPGLFLALAPMDGITDWVYRDVLTGLHDGESGISLCVSEFVRVLRDPVVPHVLLRHCPELERGGLTRFRVPVFVQLLGGVPEAMASTAESAVSMGASGIDINFGCPAKTVNNHDGGAAILKAPCRVERITSAIRQRLPSTIPVTVKIRLGWDSPCGVETLARAAEAGGASWLTIHARTRLQLYRPPVDWTAIGRAREAVTIPVVANGDIFEPGDIEACKRASGCTAFMIGRGAMARPRLFRQIRGSSEPDLELPWFCSLLHRYAQTLTEAGATPNAVMGRLKQWLRLGAPAFDELAVAFTHVKRLTNLADAIAWLSRGDLETTRLVTGDRLLHHEASGPGTNVIARSGQATTHSPQA